MGFGRWQCSECIRKTEVLSRRMTSAFRGAKHSKSRMLLTVSLALQSIVFTQISRLVSSCRISLIGTCSSLLHLAAVRSIGFISFVILLQLFKILCPFPDSPEQLDAIHAKSAVAMGTRIVYNTPKDKAAKKGR